MPATAFENGSRDSVVYLEAFRATQYSYKDVAPLTATAIAMAGIQQDSVS